MRRARLAAIGVVGLLAAAGCSQGGNESVVDVESGATSPSATSEAPTSPSSEPTKTPRDRPTKEEGGGTPTVSDTIATGLDVPWGLAFLPDGTAVVTERETALVKLIAPRTHEISEAGEIASAAPENEGGLLGVAVSPDFDTDDTLFFYVTTADDNRVVSAPLVDGSLGKVTTLLDGIPRGSNHDGGRLEFGPDGYLYVSTGETGQPDLAPDRDSLAGKILRIRPDGRPAPGNPFQGSPIWSYGHRNVQGLAFDDGDHLWASEFGDQTFDELNLIEAGGDYGWPAVEGDPTTAAERRQYVAPQATWSTDDASPSGLAYLDGSLWMAALNGERLWRIDVDDRGKAPVAEEPQDFFVGDYGRMRTVVVSPDGDLWVTTSNTDGRATPGPDDDQILEIRIR